MLVPAFVPGHSESWPDPALLVGTLELEPCCKICCSFGFWLLQCKCWITSFKRTACGLSSLFAGRQEVSDREMHAQALGQCWHFTDSGQGTLQHLGTPNSCSQDVAWTVGSDNQLTAARRWCPTARADWKLPHSQVWVSAARWTDHLGSYVPLFMHPFAVALQAKGCVCMQHMNDEMSSDANGSSVHPVL